MTQKIVYTAPEDVQAFDINRLKDSLSQYGEIDEDALSAALDEYKQYDPLHVSCLVEAGVLAFKREDDARRYYEDHPDCCADRGFERLRRITGYLVGTLDRWNDAKKAEEKARVKHNVTGQYNQAEKRQIEREKLEESIAAQV